MTCTHENTSVVVDRAAGRGVCKCGANVASVWKGSAGTIVASPMVWLENYPDERFGVAFLDLDEYERLRQFVCKFCEGTGREIEQDDPDTCDTCDGTGRSLLGELTNVG